MIEKTKRNTSPISQIIKDNLSFKKAKNQNDKINKKKEDKIDLNLKFNQGKYKINKNIDKRKLSFDFLNHNFILISKLNKCIFKFFQCFIFIIFYF